MDNGKVVRRFMFNGPCIVEGQLVRETAKFYVFRPWLGGERYGEECRLKKGDKFHVEACTRCRDHAETVYPNGYMD